jgi:hypothetical protein
MLSCAKLILWVLCSGIDSPPIMGPSVKSWVLFYGIFFGEHPVKKKFFSGERELKKVFSFETPLCTITHSV